MRSIALPLVVALAACSPATWHRAVDFTDAAAVATLACDGGTTSDFLAHSTAFETNPVLGEHPSAFRLWGYLGAVGAATIAAGHYLPPKLAVVLAGIVTAIEVDSIAVNMQVGAGFCGVGKDGPWKTPMLVTEAHS